VKRKCEWGDGWGRGGRMDQTFKGAAALEHDDGEVGWSESVQGLSYLGLHLAINCKVFWIVAFAKKSGFICFLNLK